MAEKIPRKPRILLLNSEGGGGHTSACASLKETLGRSYYVEVINLMETVLPSIDPISILTFGRRSGEDFYNYLMQKDHYRLLQIFIRIGNRYMLAQRKKIARLFEKYLTEQPRLPDLIISTIPFMNPGLIIAAHRLKIPFFLVATDLDTATFLRGFDSIDRSVLEKFKMSVAYERPEIVLQIFKHSVLEPSDLVFNGFPVRPACQKQYSPEEIEQLKNYFGMSTGKKIATLVMGAAGSNMIFEHTKVIAGLSPALCGGPLEANICVGRNRKAHAKIADWLISEGGWVVQKKDQRTSILMPHGTVMHIRGFTEELILIMACSDLIITKTGSCSVNEAIYLGKKILLDNTPLSTARYLWWEQFNIHFVKRHNLGAVFTHSQELFSLIPFLLSHVRLPSKSLKLPDFQTNIADLVSSVLDENVVP